MSGQSGKGSPAFSVLQPLSPSPNTGSFQVSTPPLSSSSFQQQSQSTAHQDDLGDFDDFGDFVDFTPPPPVPPKQPEFTNKVSTGTNNEVLVPLNNGAVQKSSHKEDTRPSNYNIQGQINELGTAKDPIRFGQHLSSSQTNGNGIVTAKWENIISSRPGPQGNLSAQKPEVLKTESTKPQASQKTFVAKEQNYSSHRKTLSQSLFKKPAQKKEEQDEWEPFNESAPEEDSGGISNVVLPAQFQGIPDSTALMNVFSEVIFHMVDQLFKELISLSYALKKRVLSNTKTKQFLEGYLETISIGAHIMVGRYRRLADSKSASIHASDRTAREFVRTWAQEIMPRLRTALPPGSMSTLNEMSTTAVSAKSRGPCCIVCGLTRDEKVSTPPVKLKSSSIKWNDENNMGHEKCLKFWLNRSTYGL